MICILHLKLARVHSTTLCTNRQRSIQQTDRSSNDDSIFAKLRRRMKSVVLGGVVVGLVGFVGKRALMGGGSSTTDRGVSTR